jgi:hypothetical protein
MQTGPRPADFADVRATNLAVVLRYVRANAPCSRADIAASTGLNKATVSSLVADLIDRRLLRETGLTEHRIGRPATMLVLDGSPYAAVGLEVNADHLTAVAIDLAGNRLLSWRRSFAGATATPRKAIAAIAGLARRAVTRVGGEGKQVLGLTVGVPGLVDAKGTVRIALNLGWRDVDLHDGLVQALGAPDYPVAVENDANLAAMAEFRYGPYAGTPNLVHITGDLGIGAGIVVDGRLLRGGQGFPGEIGHVRVAEGGPRCACGQRGCLEAVAGVAARGRAGRALRRAADRPRARGGRGGTAGPRRGAGGARGARRDRHPPGLRSVDPGQHRQPGDRGPGRLLRPARALADAPGRGRAARPYRGTGRRRLPLGRLRAGRGRGRGRWRGPRTGLGGRRRPAEPGGLTTTAS